MKDGMVDGFIDEISRLAAMLRYSGEFVKDRAHMGMTDVLNAAWSMKASHPVAYMDYLDLCRQTGVTGAPYREVNSKVATAPKLKVEDKDRVNNSRRIKTVKLIIVRLKASLDKFSRRKLVIEVGCQTLKLK